MTIIPVDKPPIIDLEKQPTIEQLSGLPPSGMEALRSPTYEQVLSELTDTSEDKIAITTNIDKKHTANTIVSMLSYAEMTKDLFRNIDNQEIQSLINADVELIKQQVRSKLKVHKSMKGYTTNKIVEAISAKVKIADRLRAGLTRYSNSADKEAL